MYISKKVEKLLKNLWGVDGCLVFIEDTIVVPDELEIKHTFIKTDAPQREYALFLERYIKESEARQRTYKLQQGGYYIGEEVIIGSGSMIEPGVFIGHGVQIGNDAHILSGAVIKNAIIGDNFYAGENCVIGDSGFIVTEDDCGNKFRIPTVGAVIIGNHVEIGALSNINRGSAGDTVLEDYVKINAQVHIGHDAHIRKNVELTAGVIVGGFADLGETVCAGLGAVIKNRIEIGTNSSIWMGSAVTKSAKANSIIGGNPARTLYSAQ